MNSNTRAVNMVHGKVSTYARGGCRCDLCRTANRNAQRAYRGSTVAVPIPVSTPARERAVRRLIEAHRGEYQSLLTEEATADHSAAQEAS